MAAMRSIVTVLVFTFAIGSDRIGSALERADEELRITIQTHDYWHVTSESLARASAVVTSTYKGSAYGPNGLEWSGRSCDGEDPSIAGTCREFQSRS